MRVIPGSHHRGDGYAEFLQAMMTSSCESTFEDQLGISGPDVPAIALETQPGDLVMFNQDLKHASFGAGTRRRMFTSNMSERFDDDDEVVLRDDISSLVRFWCDRAYGPRP